MILVEWCTVCKMRKPQKITRALTLKNGKRRLFLKCPCGRNKNVTIK